MDTKKNIEPVENLLTFDQRKQITDKLLEIALGDDNRLALRALNRIIELDKINEQLQAARGKR